MRHLFGYCLLGLLSFTSHAAVILQYHHVSSETPRSTSLSPEEFESHMALLKQEGFTVIPLPDMINTLMRRESLPDKTVAITFDDGSRDILTNGVPILTKYGYPYTIFVSPGVIDKKSRSSLTWAELNQMIKQGANVANHTMYHDYLLMRKPGENSEQAWLERVKQDILQAEKRIVEETGEAHKFLAYPYGEFNSALQTLVEELGFVGIGQHSGAFDLVSNFTRIPRFPAAGSYANVKTLKTKLYTLAFPLMSNNFVDSQPNTTNPVLTLELDTRVFNQSQMRCFASQGGETNISWETEFKAVITSNTPIGKGRNRINCTAPSGEAGRYYWFSQPWVIRGKNAQVLNN